MMKSPTQIANEELRRTLLVVLYEAGTAIRAKLARQIMDDLNSPTTWDDFVAQLEYLAGEELLRVFPTGVDQELTAVDQAKYLALCRRIQWDSVDANRVMVRIRQRGKHFLEGNADDVVGVARF